MPADRFFSKDAEVSDYRYQLGLDRDPASDGRSPRVIRGDPGLCAFLEARNRLANASTNFAVSWLEWISDYDARTNVCEFVEDLLLVGVPRTHYAYCLVAHDEDAEPDREPRRKRRAKRTAVHGKIVNLRLPSGGFLQPLRKPDRMLTTLWHADKAIKKGWAHPLDRDRIRNTPKHHRHGDIPRFKRELTAAVRAANRLPNGSPDPRTIMEAMRRMGLDDVTAKVGLLGRQGVSVVLPNHPRTLNFFGPEFEAFHQYINTKEPQKHEDIRTARFNTGNEFFPHGCLDRSPEYAERISNALGEWLYRRTEFNRRRYNLDRPTLVFGRPDLDRPAGLGLLDGLPPFRMPVPRGPTGGVAGRTGEPSRPADGQPAEVGQPVPITQQSYGKPESGRAEEGRDPDPRGAYADLGVSLASIVGGASRLLRELFRSLQRLYRTIDEIIEGRSRSTQDLAAADGRLDLGTIEYGAASRRLDEAIERAGFKAGLSQPVSGDAAPERGAPEEFVRRVMRPLNKPVVQSGPTLTP